ncbi:MAG: plasmid stabilization protein [Propionibacteriaceae bacterium]|nr:plasmid stabilization protein [Propionibacteriaceae bacterium]
MATVITVRNLDEETQRVLKHRAVENRRSFEAEIRSILNAAAREQPPAQSSALFAAIAEFREAAQGADFVIPERNLEKPRQVFA